MPGAIILGWLAAELHKTGRALVRIERMKFLRPLRPGTPFEMALAGRRAELRDAAGIFATARIAVSPAEPVHG